MEQLPRAWDADNDTNAPGHRQHNSLLASAFRYASHGPDTPAPAHDVSRRASFHLDFLIVGGGIAGLAAAYALAASGHRVRVLEQARGLKRRPGGVRLPPNATRILSYWGVEKEIAQKASTIPSTSILDIRVAHGYHGRGNTDLWGFVWLKVKTGKSIGRSAWQRDLIEELGAEYLTMNHADLVEILHRLASSAGARVTFGAVVESVEPAPEDPLENSTSTSIAGPSSCTLRPSVRLKTGEILHADVIIGADGPRSIVRRVVTEEPEPEAISTGLSVYTGSVPMSEIRKHPSLRQLAEGWLVWVGQGRVVLGYPVRRHQEFAIHVCWEDHNKPAPASRQGAVDSWDPTTSLSSIRYKEGQMDPRLRFLLDKAGSVSRQSYVVFPRLESWVDESESVVLIGEAAHPQGPGRTYSCSLALEDAAILGTLFSRLRSRDLVPTLLYAFQDLHKGRVDAVTDMEIENAEVALSNPQRIRDGLVRWSALAADEPEPPAESDPTDAELAVISEVWGYFAIDAADEWWVEWGLLRERSHVQR
ncbi:hypothetical protein EI94DRAFT_1706007 [Lactarius quietus]|nr:hypothetical protein EI94DRAFT_1706007 [Lactarius quietus]